MDPNAMSMVHALNGGQSQSPISGMLQQNQINPTGQNQMPQQNQVNPIGQSQMPPPIDGMTAPPASIAATQQGALGINGMKSSPNMYGALMQPPPQY